MNPTYKIRAPASKAAASSRAAALRLVNACPRGASPPATSDKPRATLPCRRECRRTCRPVRLCERARPDAFSDPGTHDEISNLSFDANQIAGFHFQALSVRRMEPERICVRDFIEPFRIRAARVNLNWQTERRDQNCLIRLEVLGMNVA